MKEPKYIEWLSAEVMHEDSCRWQSELNFINDELRFFQDLMKEYTIELVQFNLYNDSERMADKLSNLIRVNQAMLRNVSKHSNELKLMVDGLDHYKEEREYKHMHRNLDAQMKSYTQDYRDIKTQFFELISKVLKQSKQRRLLNG